MPKIRIKEQMGENSQHSTESEWNARWWRSKMDKAVEEKSWFHLHQLRIDVFMSTLEIVKKGGYVTEEGEGVRLALNPRIEEQTIFYDREIHPPRPLQSYHTQIAAVCADSLDYAKKVSETDYDVCVLNMANRRNPGGGVIDGCGAQEEYLFRCSDYFRSLYQFVSYAPQYGVRRASYSYPMDRNFGGCFSRGVTIFRDTEEKGYPLIAHPWQMNFIAVAALNRPKLIMVKNEERIIDGYADP